MSGPVRAVLATLLALASGIGRAAVTQWTETPESLADGTAEGIAISQRGWLLAAPTLSPLGGTDAARLPVQIWAITSDAAGNLILGTGPEGEIVRVTPAGARTVLFTTDEPLVTALLTLPGGTLLAGTAPGGRIYRVKPSGGGEVWCETGETYVWSLVAGADGAIYAATGDRGVILRIGPDGGAETFFDGDETHLVSLAVGATGELLAGGAGRGLIYRLDDEGHAHVLYDDPELEEVTSLVPEPDGGVTAALLARPARPRPPPSVRLRLPGAEEAGPVRESVGALEDGSRPVLRGQIEGLEPDAGEVAAALRGRVVRIDAAGREVELWRSTSSAPLCLASDGRGRVLFGTGEPARLWRIETDGDVSLLSNLNEGHLSALVATPAGMALGTSNPAATHLLGREPSNEGRFLSRPIDAGSLARWGSLRWREDGPGGGEMYTRTGNSALPDASWSGWGPALTDPAGSRIDNPDARYLQYRARLPAGPAGATRVSGLTVVYEPYNRSPEIGEFRRGDEDRLAGSPVILRWSARDPDGDALAVRLEKRRAGEAWGDARATVDALPEVPTTAWRTGRLSWATDQEPEGPVELRLVVTDRASNPPREERESSRELPEGHIVDRTPPEVELQAVDGGVLEIRATDRLSALGRVELIDALGRPRHVLRPLDGVCDSAAETFRVDRVDLAPGVIRATDAAGNSTERPLEAPR